MDIPQVVMFVGFIKKKKQKNQQESYITLPQEPSYTFLQTSPFFEKNVPSPFLENKQNYSPHPLCKVG